MSISTHYFPNTWTRRIARIVPNGDSAAPAITQFGDNAITGGTLATIIDSNGIKLRYTTGSTIGDNGGIQGRDQYRRALEAAAYVRFKLGQTSSCRMFIGFTDQLLAVMGGADDPAGHHFGLLYSSGNGNFRIISKNGSTQSDATIVAVDTDHHDLYLSMFPSGGADSVLLGFDNESPTEHIANIPSTTQNMRFVAAIETKSNATKNLEIGNVVIHQVY